MALTGAPRIPPVSAPVTVEAEVSDLPLRPPAGAPRGSMARGGLAAFASNVGGVIVGLAMSVVIARTLGPSGKGSYDLAMATATLLSLALGLSLPGGIAYAVARRTADAGAIERFLRGFAAAQALLALLLLLVATRVAPAVVGAFDDGTAIAIAAIVGLSSLATALRGILVGLQSIASASAIDLAGRILNLAAIAVFVVLIRLVLAGDLTYAVMLWAGVASLALACGIAWVVVRRRDPRRHGPLGLRSILGFALPAHLGNLVQFLNYRLDLFLVSLFSGIAAVGVYALAVSLAQMVWLAPGAISVVVLPRVASEAADGTPSTDVPRLGRIGLLVSVLAALGLVVAGPPFIAALYGERFAGAVGQLLLLLPGVAAFGQSTVLAAYIGGVGRQRLNLYVGCVALVVTIVFDLVLIPPFAGAGAALASSLSYGTTALLTLVVTARLGGFRYRDLLIPTRADVRQLVAGVSDRLRA